MGCPPLIITQSRSMASIRSQLVSASTLFFNTNGIASLLMQADCGSFITSPLMWAVCSRSSSSRSPGPRVGLGDEIINDDSLFTHLLDAGMGILERTVPALHREYLEDISAIELGIRKYISWVQQDVTLIREGLSLMMIRKGLRNGDTNFKCFKVSSEEFRKSKKM